jgi:hypothetical protein
MIWDTDLVSLPEAEKICKEKGQALSRYLFAEYLVSLDVKLTKNRNDNRQPYYYRNHGVRQYKMGTIFGEVSFPAHYFQIRDILTGEKKYGYIIEPYVDGNTVGHYTETVALRAATLASEMSYRCTSEALETETGTAISHQTAWALTQEVAIKLQECEERNGEGVMETPVLFEEVDGIAINMQGEDRPASGSKLEMKVALFHEGWQETPRGYSRKNLRYLCAFEDTETFFERKEQLVSLLYDASKIKLRIVGGDGAPWIKSFTDFFGSGALYQLDLFHRNRAVLKAQLPADVTKIIYDFLRNYDIKNLFFFMNGLLSCDDLTANEKNRLGDLYTYFWRNKNALIPYLNRGHSLPQLPQGLHYRNLGSAENAVGGIFALRMKGRKASWTKSGAVALGRILCHLRDGSFDKMSTHQKVTPKNILDSISALDIRNIASLKFFSNG